MREKKINENAKRNKICAGLIQPTSGRFCVCVIVTDGIRVGVDALSIFAKTISVGVGVGITLTPDAVVGVIVCVGDGD